jgi:hypothetical protein
VRFGTMFHMSNDSGLFATEGDLAPLGAEFDGWQWRLGPRAWLPLYEAKMLGHFDHRFSTYEGASEAQLRMQTLPRPTDADHDDPGKEARARYWVDAKIVEAALDGKSHHGWLMGWREVTSPTVFRTFVPCVFPKAAVNHKFPLVFDSPNPHGLLAVWSSLFFDYIARQKIANGMTFSALRQLPMPTPADLDAWLPWLGSSASDWLRPRILELTFTSERMVDFAADLGDEVGRPFRWNRPRRERIRAEVEALIFMLYGVEEADVDFVLDTFTVMRDQELTSSGEFLTKRLVLEIVSAMALAQTTGGVFASQIAPAVGLGDRHERRETQA